MKKSQSCMELKAIKLLHKSCNETKSRRKECLHNEAYRQDKYIIKKLDEN